MRKLDTVLRTNAKIHPVIVFSRSGTAYVRIYATNPAEGRTLAVGVIFRDSELELNGHNLDVNEKYQGLFASYNDARDQAIHKIQNWTGITNYTIEDR